MADAFIQIELLSDTTFASGEGTAGEVDAEIVHDELGLPEIPARRIKGLLRDAWLSMADCFAEADRQRAREALGIGDDFGGVPTGRIRIDTARLPENARAWVAYAVRRRHNPISAIEILRALTDVRRQTARDRATGSPDAGTLRAGRVALRELVFRAPVTALGVLIDDHWRVLAHCCLAVRHAGVGRSRGRGYVRFSLWRPIGANGSLVDVTARAAGLEAAS